MHGRYRGDMWEVDGREMGERVRAGHPAHARRRREIQSAIDGAATNHQPGRWLSSPHHPGRWLSPPHHPGRWLPPHTGPP